jgi:single-strand DNA-binding protein
MSGYQRFICVGNLTKDVESRMVGESEVAKFGVAVNGYKDSVEFFDCEYWKPGRVTEFLVRGTPVLVEGEIQTQSWERDGEKKSRKVVRVMRLQLLGGKRKEEPAMEEEFAADFR